MVKLLYSYCLAPRHRRACRLLSLGTGRMQTSGGIAPRSRTAVDWLAAARRYEREGELFQAYDIAMQGLARFPRDFPLKHRAVSCLASIQATAQATELFEKLGLNLAESAIAELPAAVRMDVPCQWARLRKDAALNEAGEARRVGFREAAELYERCYRREAASGNAEAYYPAINAATLWLLADHRGAADGLAREVLAGLAARPGTPSYYELVSAAEARLILGEVDAARALMVRQLAAMDIGFAYGSLAAGADILFAEAALARGASLHLVLPFDRREFVGVSVRPSGRGWVKRFERCLAAAATIRYATQDRYLRDDQLFVYCSRLAMGRALLAARHLATNAVQVAVWDGKAGAGPVGTAVDVADWRRGSRRSTRIDSGSTLTGPPASRSDAGSGRRTRAMLFGDIHGFSKLTDTQLPHFVKLVLGAFGAVVDRYRKDIHLANTWGDGLFLVFDDAGKAANCALDLQEAIAGVDLAAAGLPADMALRLGGHLGPVYRAHDPILKRDNFFGAHVSRAARIEPVTPERCVYVTETLAAVLALYNADRFDCDYVGMTQAAKRYGKMRMFLLRRRAI